MWICRHNCKGESVYSLRKTNCLFYQHKIKATSYKFCVHPQNSMLPSIFTHSYIQAFYKVIGHDKKFLVWKMCFYYVLVALSIIMFLLRFFAHEVLFISTVISRLQIYPADSCSKSGRVSLIFNERECFKVMTLAVC